MSVLENPIPRTLPKPRPHRMTVFEYEQLVSTGALEGQRVELRDGEMIGLDGVIQPPFNPTATIRVNELLPGSLSDDPE